MPRNPVSKEARSPADKQTASGQHRQVIWARDNVLCPVGAQIMPWVSGQRKNGDGKKAEAGKEPSPGYLRPGVLHVRRLNNGPENASEKLTVSAQLRNCATGAFEHHHHQLELQSSSQ